MGHFSTIGNAQGFYPANTLGSVVVRNKKRDRRGKGKRINSKLRQGPCKSAACIKDKHSICYKKNCTCTCGHLYIPVVKL